MEKLRKLISKLCSMHLVVPIVNGHFYHLQMVLAHAGSGCRAYLTSGFHQDLAHWTQLAEDVLSRPTSLAEVVQRIPMDMGFCNAAGPGAGGVWLDPNNDGGNVVWRLQWPKNATNDLVSWSNSEGKITNLDLELVAVVFHKMCFPIMCSLFHWRAPTTGLDNTPTISGSFCEASIVHPVVVDMLHLRSIHNQDATLLTSVFYYPSPLNTMADDVSRRFNQSADVLVAFFSLRSTTVTRFLGVMSPAF